jgi:elongation factor Ts
MAGYSAADVKKLRDETDAPMMECKAALDEADGDYDRAKAILREKGKAAAAKRADRSTAAGVVAFATSPDQKTVGGAVVESETDFVARNEQFIAIAQQIAEVVRDEGDESKIKELIEDAVAKIRENIKVTRKIRLHSSNPISTYVHHDRTKGAAVVFEGDAELDAVRKVAIQVVAHPPEVVSKDQLSQEMLDRELATETQRALNEGKDANIAKNIAQGRVNKEFVKKVVLLEQPFYVDNSKSVSQYLQESAKGAKVSEFVYLAVGQGE